MTRDAIWEAEDHSALEKMAHHIHSENKINGEWFGFSSAERMDVIRRISAWKAKLIFPSGLLMAKPIKSSNVVKNVLRPLDDIRNYKKFQKYAAFNAYVAEHNVDKDNPSAISDAWKVVLSQMKTEKFALSA